MFSLRPLAAGVPQGDTRVVCSARQGECRRPRKAWLGVRPAAEPQHEKGGSPACPASLPSSGRAVVAPHPMRSGRDSAGGRGGELPNSSLPGLAWWAA